MHRAVQLRLDNRTVVAPTDDGAEELLTYPGVTVARVENGDTIDEAWVPLGDEPTERDDDALFVHWQAALQWHWPPPTSQ